MSLHATLEGVEHKSNRPWYLSSAWERNMSLQSAQGSLFSQLRGIITLLHFFRFTHISVFSFLT